MFDAEHTQLAIFCHANGMHDASITLWMSRHRWHSVSVLDGNEDDVVRNRKAQASMQLPDAVREVLWIDADMGPMEPGSELQPFYEADADIVAAFYANHNPAAYASPGIFHMGMVRMKVAALRTLWNQSTDDSPLFQLKTTDRGTRLVMCVCKSFVRHVKALGLSMVRAGYCVHKNPRVGGHA